MLVATTELITNLSNFIPTVSLRVIYAAIIQVYLKLRSSWGKIHASGEKDRFVFRRRDTGVVEAAAATMAASPHPLFLFVSSFPLHSTRPPSGLLNHLDQGEFRGSQGVPSCKPRLPNNDSRIHEVSDPREDNPL